MTCDTGSQTLWAAALRCHSHSRSTVLFSATSVLLAVAVAAPELYYLGCYENPPDPDPESMGARLQVLPNHLNWTESPAECRLLASASPKGFTVYGVSGENAVTWLHDRSACILRVLCRDIFQHAVGACKGTPFILPPLVDVHMHAHHGNAPAQGGPALAPQAFPTAR